MRLTQARTEIRNIFEAGILAADPAQAVRQAIHVKANRLSLDSDQSVGACLQRTKPWTAVSVIAFGKAACAMATAVGEIIPSTLITNKGIIVTNDENQTQVDGFDVIGAGHPLPDSQSIIAAHHIAVRAKQAKLGELMLVLISGGGSSLIAYPSEGISLQDKIDTTQILLNSGTTINEINCVRKHISQLKGGNLAQLAYPADVHALILSDVIGDDPGSIASGASVPDPTTFDETVRILESHKLWKNVPDSVRAHLLAGCRGDIDETPKPDNALFDRTGYTLIGSNRISVLAMQKFAQTSGFDTEVYSYSLCGEAREEAGKLCQFAVQKMASIYKPTAIVAGGETTVTVRGDGLGGRNQEFALAFAITANQTELVPDWILLSAGSDGRDGPTNATGAIVDSHTVSRITACGGQAVSYLDNNDSYHALKLAEDLLITGPTGTNVADLQILLLFP